MLSIDNYYLICIHKINAVSDRRRKSVSEILSKLKGYYGRMADRSSMAFKGIILSAGVVDNDYRGECK